MHRVVTITDIPDDEVDSVIADFKIDGATTVTKVQQASGLWIVTAIYPDHEGDPVTGGSGNAAAGADDNDEEATADTEADGDADAPPAAAGKPANKPKTAAKQAGKGKSGKSKGKRK
jgi:hypothetical protein